MRLKFLTFIFCLRIQIFSAAVSNIRVIPNSEKAQDALSKILIKLSDEEDFDFIFENVNDNTKNSIFIIQSDKESDGSELQESDSFSTYERYFEIPENYVKKYQANTNDNILYDFLLNSLFLDQITDLSDNNFEHDTQADSGSTTGNWLITFYKNENCISKISPIFNSAFNILKIARNNVIFGQIIENNESLNSFNRFEVKFGKDDCSKTIFISKGFVYSIAKTSENLENIVDFCTSGYQLQSTIKSKVPPEMQKGTQNENENLYDKFVRIIFPYIQKNKTYIKIVAVLISLVAMFIQAKDEKKNLEKKSKAKAEKQK